MKFLLIFLTTLFNQNSFLVKQGNVEVPLADLDVYVYLLNPNKRVGFAVQKQQIEQNIYTLLNVNIVYDHVMKTDLKNKDVFKNISSHIESLDIDPENMFLDALDIEKEEMIESIKMYNIKTTYYKTMLAHVEESVTAQSLENLALEYYMINKKEFTMPENRDISVIVINSDDVNQNINAVLDNLNSATQHSFERLATEISSDPSVVSNNGHWGAFKKVSFDYSFSDTVFSAPIGVIPQVLTDGNKKYIIRVNEVIPQKTADFDQVKPKLIAQLKDKAVKRKFQNIINSQANKKLQVNPELMAHVFERYKVLAPE